MDRSKKLKKIIIIILIIINTCHAECLHARDRTVYAAGRNIKKFQAPQIVILFWIIKLFS